MKFPSSTIKSFIAAGAVFMGTRALGLAAGAAATSAEPFPIPLESYEAPTSGGVFELLSARAAQEPFNLIVTGIFLLAIIHTFLAPTFLKIAHHWRDEAAARARMRGSSGDRRQEHSFKAEIMHFFGEIEAIFGIWVVPLLIAITVFKGWGTAEHYVARVVNFTEPMFVVVIMAIASTRPVLEFSERCMSVVAGLGGRTPGAWWLSILTLGPILGSFITEPAAMTICALLLAHRLYDLKPSKRLSYATLGLLFVNISVGGTLTHFAAPPVLMVAAKWNWDTPFMFLNFGWKAVIGILVSNAAYYFFFRREFQELKKRAVANAANEAAVEARQVRVPAWVICAHLGFLAWTVFTAHYPALFIGAFLFFLAFTAATEPHQETMNLRTPMLVGFFLGGLVIHGGLQGWWIAPVLAHLGELPLMLGATLLTAFNDNAAITYLATLVPDLTDELKHAVVAGAVIGGGLTVIANAPNPAGQSLLSRYFTDGVSPLGLLAGAIGPTIVMGIAFVILR